MGDTVSVETDVRATAKAEARKEGRKKAKILRWRGVMGGSSRLLRIMVAIVLLVAGAALSFVQLGFVAVELSDGSVGYIVVLLQVVALGSLLLGTIPGMVLGVVVGGVLLAHSRVLPLDHYELMFITPTTSIVMFAVMGLILGILFAFVLRKDPSQVKRIIYITIVCIIVSSLYTIGFVISVFFSIAQQIYETMGYNITATSVQGVTISTAVQIGDMNVQMWGTTLCMAVLCIVGDYLARKAMGHEGSLGLRTVFGAWLGVVVGLAFVVTSAVSFAVSTVDELWDAEQSADSDASYLINQMAETALRSQRFSMFANDIGISLHDIDQESLNTLVGSIDSYTMLAGYERDKHGTVLVLYDGVVFMSNAEGIPNYSALEDVFGPNEIEAVEDSIGEGRMKRVIRTETMDGDEITFTEMATAADSSASGDSAAVAADSSASGESADAAAGTEVSGASASASASAVASGVASSDADAATSESLEEVLSARAYIAYLYAKQAQIDYGDGEDVTATVVIIQPSSLVFEKRPSILVWMTLSSFVLLLAVFILVFHLVNRVVVRRIDEENEALARITGGDLDTRANAGGSREFESLSDGINETVDTLKGWISEAETRIDAELATARAIQESALPRTFPPYPDIQRFDIYASMSAAKQVGGDFYDFFLIGDDCTADTGHLAFVVADVSGKGVPASLFMMKAKALLRDYVGSGLELGEAVEEANRLLVDGNDEGMFVTAWVGVLDYATGHVDYVNAGHNPPLLWRRDGGWEWLTEKSGIPLGLFEMPYEAHSLDCNVGETFLLYTDGVTEAFDVDAKLYGEDRLLAVAENSDTLHPRELLEAVRKDVAAYAKGAEQSDDITILTLEVGVPPEITATIEVPATIAQLDVVNDFLHAELNRRLCPQRVQNLLDVAVEELFVNVCNYAYPDATPENPGTVRIQRTYTADPASITVDIIDRGVPYDPLAKPDAVTPDNIADVPIGGLGILMAKRSVNEMRYERTDDCNVVTIVKKW